MGFKSALRTWLFAPGHEARKVTKAIASGADVVIVDWEDAVPASLKAEARRISREILGSLSADGRVFIRINGVRTPWHQEDRDAVQEIPRAGVVLPKVESPQEVLAVAHLGRHLVLLIETAVGFERVMEIARAHPLVERLAFGSLDFLADLRARWTPDGASLLYARSRLAVASRAAGLAGPIDGVYPRLRDTEGLRREAMLARDLGFWGKLLIHPEQIEVVREVFTPTAEEISEAQTILKAYREAQAAGRGVLQLEGKLIDPPVVQWALQVLEDAQRSGLA